MNMLLCTVFFNGSVVAYLITTDESYVRMKHSTNSWLMERTQMVASPNTLIILILVFQSWELEAFWHSFTKGSCMSCTINWTVILNHRGWVGQLCKKFSGPTLKNGRQLLTISRLQTENQQRRTLRLFVLTRICRLVARALTTGTA